MRKITVFLIVLGFIFSGETSAQLLVLKPAYKISRAGSKVGELLNPQGLAVDPAGNVYVVDTGNNRLQKFSSEGKFLTQIGGLGSGSQQFDSPRSVCASNGLNVWVADYNNHRVQRFDRNLNFVFSFTPNENWDETFQFQLPVGICESGQGDLFVADGSSNRVIKFDGFRKPVVVFGGLDAGQGQIQEIGKLALSPEGNVFVSDRQSAEIVVFDYFGNFLSIFRDSLLHVPAGLAYWEGGRMLFVADSDRPGIEAFTDGGNPVKVKFLQKDPAFRLKRPVDVAVFGGRLFVLDQAANQVLVYYIRLLEDLPPQ
ncbi:MAG: hypothetical protein GXO76_04845 [Calditrichaeota bacterium]|nr:hypothetical protein [Calditrichota bacterium]